MQVYSYEWLVYDSEDIAWKSVEAEEFQQQLLPVAIILKIEVEEQPFGVW